jgi:hypothetical protein
MHTPNSACLVLYSTSPSSIIALHTPTPALSASAYPTPHWFVFLVFSPFPFLVFLSNLFILAMCLTWLFFTPVHPDLYPRSTLTVTLTFTLALF